jgi:hypothetical protein
MSMLEELMADVELTAEDEMDGINEVRWCPRSTRARLAMHMGGS